MHRIRIFDVVLGLLLAIPSLLQLEDLAEQLAFSLS